MTSSQSNSKWWDFQKVFSQLIKLLVMLKIPASIDHCSSNDQMWRWKPRLLSSEHLRPPTGTWVCHNRGGGNHSSLSKCFVVLKYYRVDWTSCSLHLWPLESDKTHMLDILYTPCYCAKSKRSTCVLWWAHACVVVDSVHTGGVVLAVVVLAVVDVDLAFVAFKAFWTHTPLNEDRCRSRNQAWKWGNFEDFHRHNYPERHENLIQ